MTRAEKIVERLRERHRYLYEEIEGDIAWREKEGKKLQLWVARIEVAEPVAAPNWQLALNVAENEVDWLSRLDLEPSLFKVVPMSSESVKDFENSIPWGEESDRTCTMIWRESNDEA